VPVAMLLAVAACGGGSDSNSPDSGEPSQDITGAGGVGSGLNPNAVGPAPDVAGAQEGGTITILSNEAPSTLDPTRTYYTDSLGIMQDLVVRALTTYQIDPNTGDGVLVPDLATDLGTPNDDATEWTFTLKDGIKYENGTPITADDVAYATKRAFAFKELPYGPVETYGPTYFKDGDKYPGVYKGGDDFAGVSVSEDGKSVTFHMSRPFPDLPYLVSFPWASPIPESADTGADYGLKPLSTGPYKFESYSAGKELKLVKNDQWDADSDPSRHQYADGWDFKWGQDSTTLDNTIINDQGTAQTTATYDNILAPDYATAVSKNAVPRVVKGTAPCTYMWYLDWRKIKELKVRQAIGWAYPYVDAWKTAGQIQGLTRYPSTTMLPPGTAGRVNDGESLTGQDGKTTDPDKAKALLKEAGYNPGEYEIKFLYVTDDPITRQTFQVLKSAFEDAGFKFTGTPTTIEKQRDDLATDGVDINVRNIGWCSDWPNGGSWFPAQWRSGQPISVNPGHFWVKAADHRQDHILNTLTGGAENKAWGEFDVWMMQTYYPAVLTGYSGSAFLRGSKIGGMTSDSIKGMPTFQNMFVMQ
jgi:peptide/nickel transport system substrate-binding protein